MAGRGHGAGRRWAAVLALVGLLLAAPSLIGALPAPDADVTATKLRTAALASTDVGFSGFAEAAGRLALPVGEQLPTVADLFSERSTMRVWWRGERDHRVDVVTPTGETGIRRDAAGTWTWRYEAATATRTEPGPLALPSAPDLLPSSLGRRLLSEAADAELSRLGAERVAGRNTLGLRLVPDAAASAVRRVDLWVDAGSGLPLQVQVYGHDRDLAVLDTRFLDLDLAVPDASVTAFAPPPGAFVTGGPGAGLLEQADRRLRRVPLPGELAGLPRRALEGAPPAVGLYGRGVTLLAVVPVPPRLAGELRRTVRQSPGAVADELGVRVAAGPLGLMLVDDAGPEPLVLTGTVTVDALAEAAGQLTGRAAG